MVTVLPSHLLFKQIYCWTRTFFEDREEACSLPSVVKTRTQNTRAVHLAWLACDRTIYLEHKREHTRIDSFSKMGPCAFSPARPTRGSTIF